ncbi:MAG: hypothetical protein R3D71_06900 [Rickettsiales bacterium]
MTAKRFEFFPFLIVSIIYAFYAFAGFEENKNIGTFHIKSEEIEKINKNDDGSLTIKLTAGAKDRFAQYTADNIGKKLQVFLGRDIKILQATISANIDSGVIEVQKPSDELLGEVNKWVEMNKDLVSQ